MSIHHLFPQASFPAPESAPPDAAPSPPPPPGYWTSLNILLGQCHSDKIYNVYNTYIDIYDCSCFIKSDTTNYICLMNAKEFLDLSQKCVFLQVKLKFDLFLQFSLNPSSILLIDQFWQTSVLYHHSQLLCSVLLFKVWNPQNFFSGTFSRAQNKCEIHLPACPLRASLLI